MRSNKIHILQPNRNRDDIAPSRGLGVLRHFGSPDGRTITVDVNVFGKGI